jgi:putative ABC transport system permease protein
MWWLPMGLALQTLRANPLRTGLSTLGIVMGAASMAAVLSLGDGAESFARRRIEGEGLHVVLVSPRTSDRIDGLSVPRDRIVQFTADDGEALARLLGPTAGVILSRRGLVRWRAGGAAAERAAVVQGLDIRGPVSPPALLAGRALAMGDRAAAGGVVVSASVARSVAGDPGAAVGRDLLVDTRRLRIVGVLAASGEDPPLMQVPYELFSDLPLQGTPGHPALVVQAGRVELVEQVRASVQSWVTPRFGDGVTVSATGRERLREVARGFLLFKVLMGAFTAIALLVGGIGIMNVLLASVLERTREIGVRRAVGARRRDIVRQFIAESVAIAVAGSLIGLTAGLIGAFAVTALMRARTGAPIHAAVTLPTVAASLLAAALTGLVFGLYPAVRASRLSPVDAMRTE